jgi:membrane-associated phospholipid phosphatase
MRHNTLLATVMLGAALAPCITAAEPVQLGPRGKDALVGESPVSMIPLAPSSRLDLTPSEGLFGSKQALLRGSPPGPDLNIDLYHDLQVTLTGLYVAAFAGLDPPGGAAPGPPLPSYGLNGVDREVVNNRSDVAAALSDAFLTASMTLPFLASAIDSFGGNGGWGAFGEDALVLMETIAVASIICNVTKFAVRRPRPYLYDPESSAEDRGKGDARLSFYSGHTSLAFSMATAYSYLFSIRHPDSSLKLPIWLASHSLAAATGVMRVQGGKHFWTDIMTGAAIGSAIGFLVPYLHRAGGWGRLVGENRFFSDLRVTPVSYPEGGWGVNIMTFW